jgi:hypothetical protein
MQPGLSGMMAGVAVMAGIFNLCFGLWDSFAGWFGRKYRDMRDAIERLDDATDVLINGRDNSELH